MHQSADAAPAAASPTHRWPRVHRYGTWALVVGSLFSLVFAPLGSTIERIGHIAPWAGLGLALSEMLFVGGLGLMAWALGIRLGWNPFNWRSRLTSVLAAMDKTPLFWVGLALNTIGAIGTAVVLGVGIVFGLPISAWGLLLLPAIDLSFTAAVRTAVVTGVRRRGLGDQVRCAL